MACHEIVKFTKRVNFAVTTVQGDVEQSFDAVLSMARDDSGNRLAASRNKPHVTSRMNRFDNTISLVSIGSPVLHFNLEVKVAVSSRNVWEFANASLSFPNKMTRKE